MNVKHRSQLDLRSVGNLGPDIAIRRQKEVLEGSGWTIQNNFPFWIEILGLYHPISPDGGVMLTSIGPGAKVFVEEEKIKDKALIRVALLRMMSLSNPYDLTDSFSPRLDSRKIIIGGIGYTSRSGTREVYSNSQIRGFRIHNHISLPILIYFKGMLLAKIEGNNGLSYHSGGKSTVFVDNDRNGFMIGDILSVSILITTPELRVGKIPSSLTLGRGSKNQIPYSEVALTDQAISDVYIGLVTQNSTPAPNDIYAYNLGYPSAAGVWTQNFLVE